MLQWFVAPADMIINKAGFSSGSSTAAGLEDAVKLVTVNWTKDEMLAAGVTNWGYYTAAGNGYNDISAFQDNDDVTGDWVDVEGSGKAPAFGSDLWSDFGGAAYPIEPIANASPNNFQWVDMSLLGVVPTVSRGTLVAVAIKNDAAAFGAGSNVFWYSGDVALKGWKFYANGRNVVGGPGVGDPGWWSRQYGFNFALDVTLTGDIPPDINSVDDLPTTLSTADRTVNADISDENPSGGAAGVASADLLYAVTGDSTWTTVAMTGTEPNYSAVIPGQTPGTHIDYYIVATDVAGNSTESLHYGYNIFAATSTNLLVFNGYTKPTGYPQSYYFGQDDFSGYTTVGWDHDVWAYGPLTADLLNHYTNVIYIATKIGSVDSSENNAIRAWLDADASHNLAIFGDEWIGVQTGWVDGTYAAGDFFFDVLGITADHNDISYDGSAPIDGTVVHPITGTVLGGPLFDKYTQVTTDNSWTAPMIYSPAYEIGVSNYLDGVDFASDVQVDMTGDNFDSTANYAILGHRTLSAGNKIVFGTYDPISLDSDTKNETEYYWYGFSFSAPQVSTLTWFSIVTNVKASNDALPVKFALSQNYPNPFNPSTVIKFSIPSSELVTLKVYDVLGREVSTLVNKTMSAGNYEANFDASKLTSGMYIYQITAGNFVSAKKMMLLK